MSHIKLLPLDYVIHARFFPAKMAARPARRVLASFLSQARGIKFYQVPISSIVVGDLVSINLDPNAWDSNCISLWTRSAHGSRMLGHLAKETAALLAPLLKSGLVASG